MHGNGPNLRCAGIGEIVECSLKGSWEGFQIPHNFFIVVKLHIVNHDFLDSTTYCQISHFTTLWKCTRYLILWSGFKVRPLDLLVPYAHSIGRESTLLAMKQVKLEPSKMKASETVDSDYVTSSSSSSDVQIGA